MRVAVTGATGFLGRRLVGELLRRGHSVRALRRAGAAAVLAGRGLETVEGSLEAPPDGRWLEGVDALVHLAAVGVQSRDRDWTAAVERNVNGTLALVRAARAAGVTRVVATGTCLEYRGHGTLPDSPIAAACARACDEDAPIEPTDAYGASKAAGGLLLRAWARETNQPLRYLRFASVYGPGDDGAKFLPAAVAALRRGDDFVMSGGAQVREWLHIDDAVEALRLAAETPLAGVESINVGTGEGVTLRDLVLRLAGAMGADESRVRPTLPYRANEAHHLVMDVHRARSALGWVASVGLDEGLRALVNARPDPSTD